MLHLTLGVDTGTGSARSRKLNIQAAIRGAGRSGVAATCGVGFGGVEHLFDSGYGLLIRFIGIDKTLMQRRFRFPLVQHPTWRSPRP